MPDTVTYWAESLFSSKTFWLNTVTFGIAVLSATDVLVIIPVRFLPTVTALVAMGNIYLRTVTVRPVAFIAPGTAVPVSVPKIDPPKPPMVTD